MRTLGIGLVLALALSGCGGAGPNTADAAGTSSPSEAASTAAGRSASTAPGKSPAAKKGGAAKAGSQPGHREKKTPRTCPITKRQVHLVVRDWQRVAESIDREDHADYTGAFSERIGHLVAPGKACPGSRDLQRLGTISNRIDHQVSHGTAPLAEYRRAEDAGDAWLGKMGFKTIELGVD